METQIQRDDRQQKPTFQYSLENKLFFENAPTDWLSNLARIKGLQTNCDLQLIETHIRQNLQNPNYAALELGFGYGRAIRWLREQNPIKRIYGVDHCARFFSLLKQDLKNDPSVTLINCSATKFKVNEPLDLILWMWAGFFELDEGDKQIAMTHISANLIKGGQFVIEFPDEIIGHEKIEECKNGKIRVNTDFGNLNVFKGTASGIVDIAKAAELQLAMELSYLTLTAIPRRILIFEKH